VTAVQGPAWPAVPPDVRTAYADRAATRRETACAATIARASSLGNEYFGTIAFMARRDFPGSSPAVDAQAAAVGEVLDAFGALLIAQRRLRGRDARHAGELSFAQARLLAALDADAACPAGTLAEHAGMTPASVTCMLDTLEHKGLVTRERSERDRRIVLTRLTEGGRALRDQKRSEARRVFAQALGTLDPGELAAAPRVLRVLADAMEAL